KANSSWPLKRLKGRLPVRTGRAANPIGARRPCSDEEGTMRRAFRTFVVLGCMVAAFIAPAPSPAHATFPGHNGRIAFQADTGSGNQIYTVRPNGHDLFQVTHVDGEATTADWSPDGHWIAFSLNECTVARIHP